MIRLNEMGIINIDITTDSYNNKDLPYDNTISNGPFGWIFAKNHAIFLYFLFI